MKKKILILGGGLIHVPTIKTANQMGLFTVVMDLDPNAIGLKIAKKGIPLDGSNKKNVLRVAKSEKVHGILPTGDYSLTPAAYAAEKLGLNSMSLATSLLVTNKGKLFENFSKYGVPIPPRVLTKNLSESLSAVRKLGFPVILKPEYSFGASRGVIRVNAFSELEEKFKFTEKFCLKKGVVVEKYIDGLEHTIESLTIDGKTHIMAISDKIRVSDPYCVGISLDYPSKENSNIIKKLENAARKAIMASGIRNGATHIEAISRNGKVFVIDFGGRGGAGGFIPAVIIPKINGINMIKCMIQLALGEQISSLFPQYSRSVVYRFFTAKPGVVKKITGVKKVKKFSWLLGIHLSVTKGDVVEVLSNQTLRPGYFIVTGKSIQQAEKRAKLVQSLVKIDTF